MTPFRWCATGGWATFYEALHKQSCAEKPLRINLYLARCGVGSRRVSDELVLSGRVSVNGVVCINPATQISSEDEVLLDNRPVNPKPNLYFALNKPPGFICTAADERGRRTIYDLLPRELKQCHYIGRLDKESRGLLLLTTDGALAQALCHPRSKVEKEYDVRLEQTISDKALAELSKGTFIEGRFACAESVRRITPRRLKIILTQGIKRQIRVMLYRVGVEVRDLCRVRFGPVRLAGLLQGSTRELTPREIDMLKYGKGPLTRVQSKKF